MYSYNDILHKNFPDKRNALPTAWATGALPNSSATRPPIFVILLLGIEVLSHPHPLSLKVFKMYSHTSRPGGQKEECLAMEHPWAHHGFDACVDPT
jgi:hypothetical protein